MSIDHVSVYIGVESYGNKLGEDKFVADSKEGVIPLMNKHKATWQNACEQNVNVLVPVRCLRRQKLVGGSYLVALI